MTIKEKNEFIAAMFDFDSAPMDAMQTLIDEGRNLGEMWSGYATANNLLAGCVSTTYFIAELTHERTLHIEGESNSQVLRGIISCFAYILDGEPVDDIDLQQVDWYKRGLSDNLTPQRNGALHQIISRIRHALATDH